MRNEKERKKFNRKFSSCRERYILRDGIYNTKTNIIIVALTPWEKKRGKRKRRVGR